MKTRIQFIAAAILAVAFSTGSAAASLTPYAGDYTGDMTLKTGKKSRVISGVVQAVVPAAGDSALFTASISGGKGQRVRLAITLNSDGTGSLVLAAKVQADARLIKADMKKPPGGKVRVKIKASGTYTTGADGSPILLDFSGNKGKSGNNITGSLALDASGGLLMDLRSGFKQFVPGLGRRIQISFAGARTGP